MRMWPRHDRLSGGFGVSDNDAARILATYVGAGLDPAVALDLYALRHAGHTVESWAAIRRRSERAIESNVERAAETFGGLDPEEVLDS